MISRQGADEQSGTFRVEVTHPGYLPAALDGIKVERDVCHVQTREVELRLTPIP
jgi:hypothetical protein